MMRESHNRVTRHRGRYNWADEREYQIQFVFHLRDDAPFNPPRRAWCVSEDAAAAIAEGESPAETAKALLAIFKRYVYAGSDTIPILTALVPYLESMAEEDAVVEATEAVRLAEQALARAKDRLTSAEDAREAVREALGETKGATKWANQPRP